jgi:hypothetical protein
MLLTLLGAECRSLARSLSWLYLCLFIVNSCVTSPQIEAQPEE